MTIRIIDLETTGIDSTAPVVEVGSVDLLPDGTVAALKAADGGDIGPLMNFIGRRPDNASSTAGASK